MSEQLYKDLLKDIRDTNRELWNKALLRDETGVSSERIGQNDYAISFDGKSDDNTVLFDMHKPASDLIDSLLTARQYSLLLYDKGVVQAEFIISNGEIVKERLLFIKKHNWLVDKEYVVKAEADDIDWFSDEESFPLFLRVDYDRNSHVEQKHPISHMTLSNNKLCRIPVQDAISFSEFMRFILLHFYGEELELKPFRFNNDSSLTDSEKKMIHLGWS